MTNTIRYCINGCARINADNEREARHATTGHLCDSCVHRLDKWLTEIPQRYALLPDYLLPAADLEGNPESKATKRPNAPAPVRLAALDLLDTRLGRKWSGLVPTDDRRGALGTLLAIANEIRAQRGSATQLNSYVITEADYIQTSIHTLATLDGITDSYTEIKTLHRELGDAIGVFPPRAVGRCTVIEDGAEAECNGPLLPINAGVLCARCSTRWDHSELRRLGLLLKDEPA